MTYCVGQQSSPLFCDYFNLLRPLLWAEQWARSKRHQWKTIQMESVDCSLNRARLFVDL